MRRNVERSTKEAIDEFRKAKDVERKLQINKLVNVLRERLATLPDPLNESELAEFVQSLTVSN